MKSKYFICFRWLFEQPQVHEIGINFDKTDMLMDNPSCTKTKMDCICAETALIANLILT